MADMDSIKSDSSTIWSKIWDFISSSASWVAEKVSSFYDWLCRAITDMIAAIKNACGRPALSSKEKEFLKDFERDLQNINNKLPQVRQILEKAAAGDANDKTTAKNTVKSIGEPFRKVCEAA